MTAAQVTEAYRRQLAAYGEPVTLRRQTNPGQATPTYTSAAVRARLLGYAPEQLVGGIQQGDREAILLHDDLAALSFPTPPQTNDNLLLADHRALRVVRVDDATLKIGAAQIGYKLTVRG